MGASIHFLKHLDIKKSILILFGIISGLHFAVGFYSFKPLHEIERDFRELDTNHLRAVVILSDMERLFWKVRYSNANYLLSGPDRHVFLRTQTSLWLKDIDHDMSNFLRLHNTPNELHEVERWKDSVTHYLQNRPKYMEMVDRGEVQQARNFRAREIIPYSEGATISLEKLVVLKEQEALSFGDGVSRYLKDSRILITILTLLSGIVASLITSLSVNWISNNQTSKMEMLEKMSALGLLTGSIAHEVKSPLTVVKLLASEVTEIAKKASDSSPRIIEMTGKIEKNVERINDVISNLKSFARDASQDPIEVFSVDVLINNASSFCLNKLKRYDIKLNVKKGGEKLYIEGRFVELSQVLFNLLDNAADATKASHEKWIELSVSDLGRRIEIVLEDSGVGVSKDVKGHLFKTVITTKTGWSSHGLSLLHCKRVISAHKGEIFIDDDSKTTRFVIRLPKAEAQALEKVA